MMITSSRFVFFCSCVAVALSWCESAVAADKIQVVIENAGTSDIYITVRDLNTENKDKVLAGERINDADNKDRTISITSDGAGRGHIDWDSVTDPGASFCEHGEKTALSAGDTVYVYTNQSCTRAIIKRAKRSIGARVSSRTRAEVNCTGQSTYCVRRQTMSNACHVQKTTASPLGPDFLGPFDQRADAVNAMCANYDATLTDPTKCWTTDPEKCPVSKRSH